MTQKFKKDLLEERAIARSILGAKAFTYALAQKAKGRNLFLALRGHSKRLRRAIHALEGGVVPAFYRLCELHRARPLEQFKR